MLHASSIGHLWLDHRPGRRDSSLLELPKLSAPETERCRASVRTDPLLGHRPSNPYGSVGVPSVRDGMCSTKLFMAQIPNDELLGVCNITSWPSCWLCVSWPPDAHSCQANNYLQTVVNILHQLSTAGKVLVSCPCRTLGRGVTRDLLYSFLGHPCLCAITGE